jgi:hypothetical protein
MIAADRDNPISACFWAPIARRPAQPTHKPARFPASTGVPGASQTHSRSHPSPMHEVIPKLCTQASQPAAQSHVIRRARVFTPGEHRDAQRRALVFTPHEHDDAQRTSTASHLPRITRVRTAHTCLTAACGATYNRTSTLHPNGRAIQVQSSPFKVHGWITSRMQTDRCRAGFSPPRVM